MTDKPNLTRVWAGTAPGGNVVDPDTVTAGKFAAGWQAEVPPFEYFNFIQKQVTEGLAHINEQGIAVWDDVTTYPVGGLAKGSDGNVYKALVSQSGNDPVSDSGTNWVDELNNSVIRKVLVSQLPEPSTEGFQALVSGVSYIYKSGAWVPAFGYAVPQSYGGSASSGIDNSSAINLALIDNRKVYLTEGVWEIASALRIPSNTTLEFHPNATLKIQDGASSYLITNDDLVNGNENIMVIGNGATINGNKAGGQTRNYTAPADNRASHWGFGMWFVRVENLVVDNFYVLETESWGVAYWSVDKAYFGNIEFSQQTGGGNGDGVTGVGSNILIENIFGYTNDDMVAIATGGGTLGGNDMGMPQLAEIRNITIRNIKPQVKNGDASLRAVRATGRSPGGSPTARIFGLTIENVRGYTRQSLVDIANYWPELPGFILYKVILSNIEREYYPSDVDTSYAHITIGDCVINNLTIRDFRAFDVSEIPDFCTIGANAKIDVLTLDGCQFIDEVPSIEKTLIKDAGEVGLVLVSNCSGLRRNTPGSNSDGRIYFKTNTSAPKTLLRFSSSHVSRNYSSAAGNKPNSPFDCSTGASLSVSGTSDVADKANLSPQGGDVIVDRLTFALQTWNGSAWA